LSPQPLSDEERAAALEGGDSYFRIASEREEATAAHVLLVASPEHKEFVPIGVIPSTSGARTEKVNEWIDRAAAILRERKYVIRGLATDGDPNGLTADLTNPILFMLSLFDFIRKNTDAAHTLFMSAFEVMYRARGDLQRWARFFDSFHAYNNLRRRLAKYNFLRIWKPLRRKDPHDDGLPRIEARWEEGEAQFGTEINSADLERIGVAAVNFISTAQDGMDQAKTLSMFGGYNWKLIYKAWGEGSIEGSYLLLWTIMYLFVSVRTLNLGRFESIRRWTWVWGLLAILANAWQETTVDGDGGGGLYRGDPVFPRDMIHKLLHIAALHVVEALRNTVMYLEAYDTRRLEHIFGTIKPIASDCAISGFLRAWEKLLVLESCKQAEGYEPPSKGKASELKIVFEADDVVDPRAQPSLGSVWQSAAGLIEAMIPDIDTEVPSSVRNFPVMERWEDLLERLDQDPGRRPGEPLNYVSPRTEHAGLQPALMQTQAFAQHTAFARAVPGESL
jgi:hypothetical protein